MRLVESYASDQTTVVVNGRTLPVPSLVEDDEDGIRWLLHAQSSTIHAPLWARASAAGAAGIIQAGPSGFSAIIAEHFAEVRTEQAPNYIVQACDWEVFDGPPSYSEVFSKREASKTGQLWTPPTGGLTGFVHGHTHAEYSSLDGLSTVTEIVDEVVRYGQPGVALTDHGRVSGHPELQIACDKAGIKPIFGLEAYFQDDRFARSNPEFDKEVNHAIRYGYWHLILWAMNDEGLHNLWAMSTESFRDGMYDKKPRLDWDTLQRHSGGIMAASGCLRGPLSVPVLNDDEETAKARLGRLLNIFGDRFYMEIQPNALAEQEKVNRALVGLAKDFSVPLMATTDSHYPKKSHYAAHQAWIAVQTNSDVNDEGDLFSVNLDLYLQSEEDVRRGLAYLGSEVVDEAVRNSLDLVSRTSARIGGKPTPPVFSKKGGHERDAERLLDLCLENWKKVTDKAQPQSVYIERFEREFKLLQQKDFCGYFLMVSDYCLDPSTPVLTEDMRWVEVGKLEVGDRLAGFDEHKVVKQQKGHRYWHSAEVVNTRRIVLPTYKITLADGTETITSEDHQWLVTSPSGCAARWIRTKDLRVGQRAQRLVSEWDEPNTWEAGYLAGILDGEGSLSTSKMNNGGRTLTLSFAQKEGVVLDTSLKILDSWGFDYSVKDHGAKRNGLRSVSLRGGRAEIMRLLGMVRPQRLLAKLDVEMLGRVVSIDTPAIVSIEPLGMGEVVALETTTGTLVAQGFAHHNCRWAKKNGILVGPGRGSGGGSLVAYLCDITEIDPVEGDLPFERFMTEGRTSLPDFDCDFPASMKERMLGYVRDTWGKDQVVQIGTHLRLKSKGIVKDLKRAMMSTLLADEQRVLDHAVANNNDYADAMAVQVAREALTAKRAEIETDMAKVSKIVTEAERGTAGLGMAWDDLWIQFGDQLQPYRDKYPELFSMADVLQGRLKSYGKHAAGVVISTGRPLTDWLPMAQGEDEGNMVTQFDMGTVEAIGLVKFDILTIRTLDTVQMAVDLIKDLRGVDVEIYSWKEEYSDPQVWGEVAAAKTLGIFQIETSAGTRLCQQMGPRSLQELCDMITLVRPGPMNSGLTEAYLKRRAGLEPVSYPDPRMEQVLGSTWGCMIYQEQIMQACILLGGYSSDEADEVRKILGKKKVEKIGPAGQEFVSRAVQNGMEREAASRLWDQMAEFAKYSFGKAHAYAYAVLAYWTAWLKFHYPIEFFTAALSTIDKERIPEFIKELRRAGYTVLPPDINASGKGFKAEPLAVRYGLDSINGIGEAAVDYLVAGQYYPDFKSYDEYVTQKGTGANAAVQMTLARIGALDSLEPRRAAVVRMLEARKTGEDKRCVFKNDEVIFSTREILTHRLEGQTEEEFEEWRRMNVPPDTCTFDWSTEEAPVNKRTGKKLKKKSLPKKCTKACRQYKAPEPVSLSEGEDFTDEEIRAIEHELLGVFLSSSPFDRLDPEDRQRLYADAEAMADGEAGRLYTVAAILMGIRLTKTRANGDEMAFLKLDTETSTVEAVCFPRKWAEIKTGMYEGQLCLVVLEKQDDDKGFIAQEYLPVH